MKEDTIFFGPFLGSLEYEITRWQGFCRFSCETEYKEKRILVASYPGREPLYSDFSYQFLDLPAWFLERKYNLEQYEPKGISPKEYSHILRYFEKFFDSKTTKTIRTPREDIPILTYTKSQKIKRILGSEKAHELRKQLLGSFKEYIVVSAGGRWDPHKAIDLVEKILQKYPAMAAVFTDLSVTGSRITNIAQIDEKDKLDLTFSLLNNAICSISAQSILTYLSLHSQCPSLIIGEDQNKFMKEENYLKTLVLFINTPEYLASASDVFKHFDTIYSEVKKREKEEKE